MEYSHKLARSTTDTLEKLVAFIEERRRSDSLSADVAEFEKDVRALCSAVERAATTEELARFDVHAPAVRGTGFTPLHGHFRPLRTRTYGHPRRVSPLE